MYATIPLLIELTKGPVQFIELFFRFGSEQCPVHGSRCRVYYIDRLEKRRTFVFCRIPCRLVRRSIARLGQQESLLMLLRFFPVFVGVSGIYPLIRESSFVHSFPRRSLDGFRNAPPCRFSQYRVRLFCLSRTFAYHC